MVKRQNIMKKKKDYPQKKRSPWLQVVYILLAFTTLAVCYFLPAQSLESLLPEGVVRLRIAYPVAALALFGGYLGIGWKFTVALLLSCTGDAMGAMGSFIGQMGYFALAHVFYIWAFSEMLYNSRRYEAGKCPQADSPKGLNGSSGTDFRKSPLYRGLSIAAIASALVAIAVIVIPAIPEVSLRWGCSVYAALLATMTLLALLQRRSPLFSIGAALFLISDFILSWNRFVNPVSGERWLIMVPYYAGQALLWLGAVKLMLDSAAAMSPVEASDKAENQSIKGK